MAYFECMVGGAGGGATITVTYNSSFYNKTMTCSNGTKTYTKTTTSSGSTEFKVSDEGTWTITCNSVSRTVNVVLNYSVAMLITKTVTVYGAAGATISFTDAVGSKTVTLNNSGQGSVSISIIPPSQTITFTDTNKAKNPNNLSQKFTKNINISNSTTAIDVMPVARSKVLYWYGYKGSNFEEVTSANGWSYASGYSLSGNYTYNTNAIHTSPTTSYAAWGVGASISATMTKGHCIVQGVQVVSGFSVIFNLANSKSYAQWGNDSASINTVNTPTHLEVSVTSSSRYPLIWNGSNSGAGSFDVFALWYE